MSTYADRIGRVTRSRAEAGATYDRISRWYDLLEGMWEAKLREKGLRKLAPTGGETVLEIGFGTGHSLVGIARAVGGSGRIHGVDLSARMVEIAAARLERAGLSATARLKQADAVEGLPYEEGLIGAIFMSFTLELFDTDEIPRVLAECRRVLRDDGRICVVSLSKAGNDTLMRCLYERAHERWPRLLDCRPILVQEALEEAGFAMVDASLERLWGLPVEIVLSER